METHRKRGGLAREQPRLRAPGEDAASCEALAHQGERLVFGAGRDLERLVDTHLFCVVPNHGGSSFLRTALETSHATWNLTFDGPWLRGYVGPRWEPLPDFPMPGKVWAAEPRWAAALADPARHDWQRTRHAWYFQAHAWRPDASVFVEKSVRNPAQVRMLASNFRNAKFLFVVRNPYAVCEGIWRTFQQRHPQLTSAACWGGEPFEEVVARHVLNILLMQARNLDAFGDRGIFFTYEELCRAPEHVAQRIRALVPALGDLRLRQRLSVKGTYDEPLTDMNAKQIARLNARQVAAFNRVFAPSRNLIEHFGYELLAAPTSPASEGSSPVAGNEGR